MSRQPAMRGLIESLRSDSETVRADQIRAGQTLADRNNQTLRAAWLAREQAAAALTAAQAAVAAAASAQAAVTHANGSVTAAVAATTAANAATAAAQTATAVANVQLARIGRTNVWSTPPADSMVSGPYSTWLNNLGLSIAGDWTGMVGIASVHIPILGAATIQNTEVELRLNGTTLVARRQNMTGQPLSFVHAFDFAVGPSHLEVWWYRGSTAYTEGPRHLTVLAVPA